MPSKTNRARAIVIMILSLSVLHLTGFSQNSNSISTPGLTTQDQGRIIRLEKELDQLRTVLKIPGMSAAILKDQKLIWAKGFGYSDYENKVAATPETPYEIASLTKTFAATLLMQLVEQGKVSLDDPMSKYSVQYKDEVIKVRHVLTHTSEGQTPGESYKYNGNLFANLFDVIVKASGKRYRLLLVQNILEKLGTTGTSPGNDVDTNPAAMTELLGPDNVKNYLDVSKRLASSYRLYGADEVIHSYNPVRGLSTSTGMISNVTDLAKYDLALDRHLFVQKATQEKMWTATTSNSGATLPYGLGWMVQQYRGSKLVWHYGHLPDAYSALILKIPEKRLTLILLANSDALSAPVPLGKGDVMKSPFAGSFMRTFLFEDEHRVSLPAPNWESNDRDFRRQLASLQEQTKPYRYELEASAHDAISHWRATRRAEARKISKVDTKIYSSYVGEYQVGTNPPFTILNEGGHLMRQGRSKIELFPESETVFFAKAVDAQFTFVKDDTGKVTHIKIRQGESERLAQRLRSGDPAEPATSKP